MHAGKLSSKAAEDLAKSARERKISFIGAVIASGAVSAFDLAHTLSTSLALPLVDVAAIKARNFRVVVDAVNSCGGFVVPQLLEALGDTGTQLV